MSTSALSVPYTSRRLITPDNTGHTEKQDLVDKIPDKIPDKISDKIPDKIPDKISDKIL